MKKLIFISLIFILLASGCATKEQKYVNDQEKSVSVEFTQEKDANGDLKAYYNSATAGNSVQGTWRETDTNYYIYFPDGSSLKYVKLGSNRIGLVLDNDGALSNYTRV